MDILVGMFLGDIGLTDAHWLLVNGGFVATVIASTGLYLIYSK